MRINKRKFTDYSLVFLVIAISGIPYFSTMALYIPVFFLLVIVFIIRGYYLDKKFLIIMVILTVIILSQTYTFQFYSLLNITGIYLRIVIGYLIIKVLQEKFTIYYVHILYYLTFAGTTVYLFVVTMPPIASIVKSVLVPIFRLFNIAHSHSYTVIVYNFDHIEAYRNSGPFWEPGAFGGYLIIAIIFLYFDDTIEEKSKKLKVFLFGLLTTISTTAIAALIIFLFFYYFHKIKNISLKIGLIAFVIFGVYFVYISFDFIGKKIEHQYDVATKGNAYGSNTDTQRFLSFLRDWEDFKGHELAGRGFHPLTRFKYVDKADIRTVGFSDIIVRLGLPFFILTMILLYKSIFVLIKHSSFPNTISMRIGTVLTIFITLLSETYYLFPLYWSLSFLFLIKHKEPHLKLSQGKLSHG